MFWDRLGFYGMPAVTTVGLHLLLIAVLTFHWPETKTVIAASAKPKIIQAALVDASSLRPKQPPAKKPAAKPAQKPKPAPPRPASKPFASHTSNGDRQS